MEKYFEIDYCFGKEKVLSFIENMTLTNRKTYVCVADGVTLSLSHKNEELRKVLDESGINVCDSGWVPLYLKSLYKVDREQYSGSNLLMDLVSAKKYKFMFLGATEEILSALKTQLSALDSRISDMPFLELPFLSIDEFDYSQIAQSINEVSPDIIFISLGMPKQEFFMHRLKPYLNKGVLIGVGAAFKFHSGLQGNKRAPQWMIRYKMEWVYRILSEPKKQIKRCALIIGSMPMIYFKEYKKIRQEI